MKDLEKNLKEQLPQIQDLGETTWESKTTDELIAGLFLFDNYISILNDEITTISSKDNYILELDKVNQLEEEINKILLLHNNLFMYIQDRLYYEAKEKLDEAKE